MVKKELASSKDCWNYSKQHFKKVFGTIDLPQFVQEILLNGKKIKLFLMLNNLKFPRGRILWLIKESL